MNAQLETLLVPFLTSALSELDDPAPVIRPAASKQTLPTAAQLITIAVRQPERVVGPLYYVFSHFTVETPTSLTVEAHTAAVLALQDLFLAAAIPASDTATALAAALEDTWGYDGNWTEAPHDDHGEKAWKTTLIVKLGLTRL